MQADQKTGDSRSQLPLTTVWELLQATQAPNVDERREAYASLVEQYWRPVYVYLLAKGHGEHQSLDLAQGFFADVFLTRDLAAKADRGRGRFRTFLFSALENHVRDVVRHERAQKRRPEHGLIQLDVSDLDRSLARRPGEQPEHAFVRAWVSQLLDEVISECRASCESAGLATHWSVFHARVIEPLLYGGAPPAYDTLSERYGIGSVKRAANMLLTIRRRFTTTLRNRLREMVDGEEQVDQELDELMHCLQSE